MTKKIFVIPVLFLVISSLIFTQKVMAGDFGGAYAHMAVYVKKEFILDTIARGIARTIFRSLTNQIVQKIQGGGRNGGPAFVLDWRVFMADAQHRGEDVFRAMLASSKLCDYFDKDVKFTFNASQKIKIVGSTRVGNFDSFQLRAACTLPNGFDINKYKQDFSNNGGWEAWSRLLEPQNNYYGVLFQSLDEANTQRTIAESSDVYEALSGQGYTSIRDTCKDEAVEGPPLPSRARCTFMGQVFTPADLLGKSAAATIDNELGWLTTSDEMSEAVIGIIDAVIKRLTNFSGSQPIVDTPGDDGSAAYLSCVNACGPLLDDPDSNAYGYCIQQCSP